ncbi:TPA: hypothetical protein ACTXXA_003081 [Legionella anisa]
MLSKSNMLKDTPQKCIDALRRGDYSSVLNLGQLVYDRYVPLNDGKSLEADEVTPLMASLLAETDITLDDIVKIQHGIQSSPYGSQQQYYSTQMMSAATTLLGYEAWLVKKEDNPVKLPEEIRQMVKDDVAEAIKRPKDPKKDAAKEVVKKTMLDMDEEMLILINKEGSFQRVFAYAVNHLIKENVDQIREKGKLISDYLDRTEAYIEALDRESKILIAEVRGLRKDLEGLNKKIDTLSSEVFSAQKNELEKNIASKQNRLSEIEKSRRGAYTRKLETEDQLSILITQPEKFKDHQMLEDHILGLLKRITNGREQISAKETLSELPGEEYLLNLQQNVESYLDFLDQNRPDKDPKWLKTYAARKDAAENMLIFVKTAGLREPAKTLEYLQNSIKTIENNRPGLFELGFIDWVKSFFKKYEAEMVKKTDGALVSTQNELQTIREDFAQRKKALGAIKEGLGEGVIVDEEKQSKLT